MAGGGAGKPAKQSRHVLRPDLKADDRLWVLRSGEKYLGRGGKNLSLTLVDDPRDASVWISSPAAQDEADRAEGILGVSLKPVRMAIKDLI